MIASEIMGLRDVAVDVVVKLDLKYRKKEQIQ